MTPAAKKVTAVVMLALLALPTGLCSLVFTPMGLASYFGSHDSLERSIGLFALMCSAVGWAICALTIWAAVRLNRSATRGAPPTAAP